MAEEPGRVLTVKGTTLTVYDLDPSAFLMKFRTDFPTWLADSFPLATLDLTAAPGEIPRESAAIIVRTFRELEPGGPEMLIKVTRDQESALRKAAAGLEIPLRIVDPEAEAAERERKKKEREERRSSTQRPRQQGPRMNTAVIEREMMVKDSTDEDGYHPEVIQLDGHDEAPAATTGPDPSARDRPGSGVRPPIPTLGDQPTLTVLLASSDDDEEDMEYFWVVDVAVKAEASEAAAADAPVTGHEVSSDRLADAGALPEKAREIEYSDLSGPSLRKPPPAEGENWVKSAAKLVYTGPKEYKNDRRRWPRFPVREAQVLFKLHTGAPILKGDQLWKGPLVNLSQGGAQFVTNQALVMGKLLRLLLDLPAFTQKIAVDAKVIWTQEYPRADKLFHRVGVSFVKMDPDDSEKLLSMEKEDELKNRQRTDYIQ